MKKIILLLSILSLLPLVLASPMCFPETDPICSTVPATYVNGIPVVYPCLCTNALYSYGNYYCDIDDIVTCVNGCQNGACIGGVSECIENNEECRDNQVYKCLSGKWILEEKCYEKPCKEENSNTAYCEEKRYYCTNPNGPPCFWSTQKQSNCYDTVEECNSNIGYCCNNNGVHTWRLGDCLSNEIKVSGTAYNEAYCKSLNNPSKCELTSPSDCGKGVLNICSREECEACNWFYVPNKILPGGSCYETAPAETCKDCEAYAISYFLGSFWKSKKCEGKNFTFEWDFLPQSTTKCMLAFIKLLLTPIAFIFTLLFSLQYLTRFKELKGKNKKLIRFILAGFIGVIIGYLIYMYFWFGVLFFGIILAIKSGIKSLLPIK